MTKTYPQIFAGVLKYAAVAVACLIATPAAYLGYLQLTGNFHVVAAGSLYRSAQPSDADLKSYVRDWGIRSVVNLRHNRPDNTEREKAGQLGISYYQYPLSAGRLLTASDITSVMEILAEAPKPILIHSQFGSDRAGLISAIYLLRVAGKSVAESAAQLSPIYGHLPFLGSPTVAMDQTFVAVAGLHGS